MKIRYSYILSIGAAICIALLGFFINIILARFFEPAARGEIANIVVLGTVTAALAQMGLAHSLIFYTRKTDGWLARKNLFSGAIAVVLFSLVIGFFLINRSGSTKVFSFWLALILMVAMAFHQYLYTIAQIDKKMVWHNLIKLIPYAVLMFGVVLLIYQSWVSKYSVLVLYVFAYCSSLVAFFLFGKFYCKVEYLNINKSALWSYALKYHGVISVGVFVTNFDKLFLIYFSSNEVVGLYIVGYAISRIIGTIQEPISNVLFSRLAGVNGAVNGVLAAFRLTFYPMVFLTSLILPFGSHVFFLVFGNEYFSSYEIFSILIYECLFTGSSWILAQAFTATGNVHLILYRQIISVIPLFFCFLLPRDASLAVNVAILVCLSGGVRFILTVWFIVKVESVRVIDFLPKKSDFYNALRIFKR